MPNDYARNPTRAAHLEEGDAAADQQLSRCIGPCSKEILSSSPLREEEDAQQTLAAKKEKEEAER